MIKMMQKKQRGEPEIDEADVMENSVSAPESGEGEPSVTAPGNNGDSASGSEADGQDADAAKVIISAPAFTKRQLMQSKKYASRRDLLSALLSDDKPYTAAETDKLIDKFMKGVN